MQKLVPFPLAFPDLWPAPAAAIVRLRTALALVVVDGVDRRDGAASLFPPRSFPFTAPYLSTTVAKEALAVYRRRMGASCLPFT